MADIATASKTITLLSLESLDEFQKVTVNIKVVELKDETQLSWGGSKRDISVADESGMARVSVWEGNVNAMEKDQSYCLTWCDSIRGQNTSRWPRKAPKSSPMRTVLGNETEMMSCWWSMLQLQVSLTSTRTNRACSTRLEFSHTPNGLANDQRWTAWWCKGSAKG